MKTCVFAGSFDPFTIGHEYVVKKALKAFDKVIIALGENVDKNPMFTLEQRINIISKCFEGEKGVEIATFKGMLVDFMKEKGVIFNVRGIRNEDDYKYETTMARYNLDAYPELVTLYIPTPSNLMHVSSSAMRNILKLKGKIKDYVPAPVEEYIKEIIVNK